MHPDPRSLVTAVRSFVICILLTCVGCSTTGHDFDASSLDQFQTGQTTLRQASVLLGAHPVDIYRQGERGTLARWATRASFVPDAVYFNRELWLAFDARGYFEGVVKSVNVPQASLVDTRY